MAFANDLSLYDFWWLIFCPKTRTLLVCLPKWPEILGVRARFERRLSSFPSLQEFRAGSAWLPVGTNVRQVLYWLENKLPGNRLHRILPTDWTRESWSKQSTGTKYKNHPVPWICVLSSLMLHWCIGLPAQIEGSPHECAQYVGWHYLSNATCQIRPRLFSTALLV